MLAVWLPVCHYLAWWEVPALYTVYAACCCNVHVLDAGVMCCTTYNLDAPENILTLHTQKDERFCI